jgi:hypothetical protein
LRKQGDFNEVQVPCPFVDTVFGGDCVYNLCAHVVDHMLNGAPLENEASDYLHVQATERAAYLSAERLCWVDVASSM